MTRRGDHVVTKNLALRYGRALSFAMRWTEKQIETWLEPISRNIVDAAGRSIELEQSALFWEYFDALREKRRFTEGWGHVRLRSRAAGARGECAVIFRPIGSRSPVTANRR